MQEAVNQAKARLRQAKQADLAQDKNMLCVCLHACMRACACMRAGVCARMHLRVCVHVCMRACMCVCATVCACVLAHMRVRAHVIV